MDKEYFGSIDECIDELLVRFIINAPEYELSFDDNYGPMFLFEKAYYFYKDHTSHPNTQLTMPELIKEFFTRTDCLKMPEGITFDKYKEGYTDYVAQINVCGGILVSADKKKVLLVKEFFDRWGLPKGKINGDETNEQCAEREIFEETGYRTGDLTGCDRVVIKFYGGVKKGTFFIINDVPQNNIFAPAVKGEIKGIRWFDVNSITNNTFTKATRDAISSYKSLLNSKMQQAKKQQQQQQQGKSQSGQKQSGGGKKGKKGNEFRVCLESPKLSLDVDSTINEILDMYFV